MGPRVSDPPGPEHVAGPTGEEDAVSEPSEGNGQSDGGTTEPAATDATTDSASDRRKQKKTAAADSTRDEASIRVPLPEPEPEAADVETDPADDDRAERPVSSPGTGASSVVGDSARSAMPPASSPPPSGGYSSNSPYGPPPPAPDGPARASGPFGPTAARSFGRFPATGPTPAAPHGPGPGHGPGLAPGANRQERLAGLAKAAKGVKAAKGRKAAGGGKAPRRAHLQVARLEPWSVMKFSFVMSLVCFVVLLVAVIVLYVILSGLGVFDAISSTVNDLTREQGTGQGGLDAESWFSFSRVFGYTVLIGAVNVLLITALSTVGSVIYNMAADLVGGVEVTLKEAE